MHGFEIQVQVKKEKTGELFVTVSRDHRLKHVRLRVYRCGEKKQGPDICETVRKAFTASNRASELRNGQPFMYVSFPLISFRCFCFYLKGKLEIKKLLHILNFFFNRTKFAVFLVIF